MRLYIIRHADPDYENNTITEAGHLEAQALAKRLALKRLDRIYCSPLGRAMATMKYTAEALGVDYTIEGWLREMYPELWIKDTPWGEVPAFQIPGEAYRAEKELPTQSSWYNSSILKDKGVKEAIESLRSNSDTFLSKLGYERKEGLYRCIRKNHEQVAVFCHAGLALSWLSLLLEIPMTLMWSGFWLPPSSVTTILFEENSEDWAVPRCIGLGDISHLYAAGLQESTVGLMANLF